MTAEQKAEAKKTFKGPLVTIITSIGLALFWWAVGYKAVQTKTADDIKAVEKTANATATDFKDHCSKQTETDIQLARELGAISKSLQNIERKLGND